MLAFDFIQLYIYLILGVLGDVQTEIKIVRAIEGETVPLNTGLTGQQNDSLLWTFGPVKPETKIATQNIGIYTTEYNERLQLDTQSGSLTIKSSTTDDSGIYQLQIFRIKVLTQTFNLTIYAPVSAPNISPIKKESCSVVCTMKNGREVTLSWYRGEKIINQTNNPDTNISLYLSLEIKEEDIYICVANNPVSNQTSKLRAEEHCQQHTGPTPPHSTNISNNIPFAVLIPVCLITVIGILSCMYWKKRKQKHEDSSGVIYAVVQPAQKTPISQLGGNDGVDPIMMVEDAVYLNFHV